MALIVTSQAVAICHRLEKNERSNYCNTILARRDFWMRYIIAFCILLCSCTDSPITPYLSIESGYEKYVTMFEEKSYTINNHIKVNSLRVFSTRDLGGTIIAQCRTYYGMTPTIVISLRLWNTLNDIEKEMVFLHEGGHCLLHRKHLDDVNEKLEPVSLMSSILFSQVLYTNNKEYYIKELFENKP